LIYRTSRLIWQVTRVSLVFGAIADDLTGGCELASMLRAQGVRCDLVTDPSILSGGSAAAVVVALRTRVAPPDNARSQFKAAGAALRAQGARQLFFKYCATFDSTDDGNIGPCAEVLTELTGNPLTVFAPAFPEAGRRVFQGHLFVGSQLVSESPKRDDPLTPMTDPNLVRVLQRQTALRVGLVAQESVRAGAGAVRKRFEDLAGEGVRYAIADAALPDDLATLAAASVDHTLATGNSSIAAYYPALWRQRGWLTAEHTGAAALPGVSGPGVVLAGSCAEKTLRQLEVFGETRPVLNLDLLQASSADDAVADAVDWALANAATGPVAIATSAGVDVVAAVQSRLGRLGAASAAESILGRIAAKLREAGFRRFLVAGGETSGAVLEHLGARRLDVGAYRGPGLAQAVTDGPAPLAISLKSGKLGPDDMFLPMLASMEAGQP
jgi:3-dehydrotetronate 4-kinase